MALSKQRLARQRRKVCGDVWKCGGTVESPWTVGVADAWSETTLRMCESSQSGLSRHESKARG